MGFILMITIVKRSCFSSLLFSSPCPVTEKCGSSSFTASNQSGSVLCFRRPALSPVRWETWTLNPRSSANFLPMDSTLLLHHFLLLNYFSISYTLSEQVAVLCVHRRVPQRTQSGTSAAPNPVCPLLSCCQPQQRENAEVWFPWCLIAFYV